MALIGAGLRPHGASSLDDSENDGSADIRKLYGRRRRFGLKNIAEKAGGVSGLVNRDPSPPQFGEREPGNLGW